MKKIVIIMSAFLLITIGLTGCVTTSTTTQVVTATPTTTTEIITATPTTTPEYHTVNFTLDKTNTDYVLPIYLHNNDTLHFLMTTNPQKDAVWIDFLTPNGKSLGSSGNGQFANGTLEENQSENFPYYMTSFKPSDYSWGEGYYRVDCNTNSGPVNVSVEYWIQN
jgi:hypothetical protein